MEKISVPRGLRIVRWRPVSDGAGIPPMGEALRAHIEAYRNPAVRAASASAWELLYETLLEAGLQPGEAAFTERGKPYFPGSALRFSLSHAGGLVAVSLADVPTGVDVERNDRPMRPQTAARCFTEAETAALGGDPIRIWCRKECVVKLTGKGLTGFPLDVDALDPRCEFREELLTAADGVYRLTAAFARRAEKK